ncbi:hypothetical protein NDU88_010097 [Pleurodeles waltl]|uniref:Uncharacterized protein n=1 Tax=Pleurodeles waltl TaxID=8319 RepID=A0AAV7PXU5_PLEWA|nr:hypothetical protein NDU88_010097 [Pleurodeles waltl]
MGKTDNTQAKLDFEQRKKNKPRDRHADDIGDASGDPESDVEPELKYIITAMQQSLPTIDGKIDSLSFRMDRMSERLHKYAECLDAAERRISEVDVDHNTVASAQSKMDKTTATLQAKVDDLEACSRRSNIRVVSIAESTAIDNMECYI